MEPGLTQTSTGRRGLALGLGLTAATPSVIVRLLRAEIEAIWWRGPGSPPALPLHVPVVEARGRRSRHGLASLIADDRDERDAALADLTALFDWALGVGGTTVVLRLPAPRRLEPLWEEVRDAHLRGSLDPAARTQRLVERGVVVEQALDRTRGLLDKILDQAERSHCRLALVNPSRYLDLPAPHEAEALLAEFEGGPLSLWFDGPAAHLQDSMGMIGRDWLQRVFDRDGFGTGCFVGDACGPIGALAPGRGALHGSLRSWIGKGATRIFSAWSGLSVDEALNSYLAMRSFLDERAG